MFNGKYAIVIGGAHFNSLGIIRSLGEAGIKTVFINMANWSFSENSKYTMETVCVKDDYSITRAIIDTVQKWGGKPSVFPSCDYSALYLDENYNTLKDFVYCPGCNGELKKFISKEEMCKAAREAGFVVPETQYVNIDDSFRRKLEDFGLPLIIKPTDNFNGSKNDILICTKKEHIVQAVGHFRNYKKVLVQRYVDGKENLAIGYSGCKTKGKKAEVYGQIERVREYPVDRGSTSYAVIKKENTYIDMGVFDKFFDITQYNGVFDFDFKVVDGVPYFIEINFRSGALSYAFTKGGFNIFAVWDMQQRNEAIEPIDFHQTKLICEGIDLSHVFDKNIKFSTWIKDYITADAHMVVNKNDMKPFIKQYKIFKPFFEAKFHKN